MQECNILVINVHVHVSARAHACACQYVRTCGHVHLCGCVLCVCIHEERKKMRTSKINSKSINSYTYYLHILQLFSFLLKCSKQSCLVGLHMNVDLLKPIRQTFIFFFVISPLQHSCFKLFLLLFNFLILKTLQYIRDCTTEF